MKNPNLKKIVIASFIILGTCFQASAQLKETEAKKYGTLDEVFIESQRHFSTNILNKKTGHRILVHCVKEDESKNSCLQFQFFLQPIENRPYFHPLSNRKYSFGQVVPIYSDAEKMFQNGLRLRVLPLTKNYYAGGVFYGTSDQGNERAIPKHITSITSIGSVGIGAGILALGTEAAALAVAPYLIVAGVALFSAPTIADLASLPVRGVARGSQYFFREMKLEKREEWFEEDLRSLVAQVNPKPIEVSEKRFNSLIKSLQEMDQYME
jgi:hypothetical protein